MDGFENCSTFAVDFGTEFVVRKVTKTTRIMRKIVSYIIILCALSACATHDRKSEQVADATLRTADSLENALQTYADIPALQDAAETFRAKGQTAKEAKVIYHLGKAYLAEQQDSLAFECFSQAANEFLYLAIPFTTRFP